MTVDRPNTLERLSEILVTLATEGRIPANGTFAHWLQAIGVGNVIGDELHAREEWVCSTFPVKDRRDLMRQTAFRDPDYRHHLDMSLGQVLVRMGRDDRLAKVEKYLTKQLSRFAPRFTHLLCQMEKELGQTTPSSDGAAFSGREDGDQFAGWDNDLFGAVLGGAAQRFPLIAEIYGPQASSPVYVNATSYDMDDEQYDLLAALIHSATERNGVALSEQQRTAVNSVRRRACLPIRVWDSTEYASVRAACISPIVLIASKSQSHMNWDRCTVPGRLSRELITGGVDTSAVTTPGEDIWAVIDKRQRAGAYPGFNIYDPHFNTREMLLSKSPDLLAWLSRHRLFGLLFQFFVIEAFDRELADDSITVLPVGSSRQPERVDVYFRPDGAEGRYAIIGSLDDVLTTAAQHLGMYTPPRLWSDSSFSLWSKALLALLDAKVISFQSGEYLLEKTVFDECHSRDHMQAILRRGRDIRDEIKVALRAMYQTSTIGETRENKEETVDNS